MYTSNILFASLASLYLMYGFSARTKKVAVVDGGGGHCREVAVGGRRCREVAVVVRWPSELRWPL